MFFKVGGINTPKLIDILQSLSLQTLMLFSFYIIGAFSTIVWASINGAQLSKQNRQLLLTAQKSPSEVLEKLESLDAMRLSNNREKAEYYLLLCDINLLLTLPEKSTEAAEKGLTFASEFDHPWLYHKLNIAYAYALDMQGRPEQGVELASNVIKWSISTNDQQLQVESYLALGTLQTSLFAYIEALESLQKAYTLAPQIPPQESPLAVVKGDITASIGLLYEYRREDALARPYFEESVKFYRQQENPMQLSISLYGLGRANLKLGAREAGKKQLGEALVISLSLQDQQGVAYALRALASAEMKDNNYAQAKQLQEKAYPLFKKSNNTAMLFDYYQTMAKIAIAMDDLVAAGDAIAAAKAVIAEKAMPLKAFVISGIESKLLAQSGDYQKAYHLLLKTEIEKAKFSRNQSTEKFHQMRTKYELEVKEKENALQKVVIAQQDSETYSLYLIVFGLVAFCSLLFLFIFRSWRHKIQLQKLANTDSLTGLANRRAVLSQLVNRLSESQQNGQALTVAIADLDQFKRINDRLGHAAGDKVIEAFAQVLIANTRLGDHIGRIGGEEFLIVLPDADLNGAELVLDKVRNSTHSIGNQISSLDWQVSVSIGAAQFSEGMTAKELIKDADRALYKAKSSGRDKIVTV
jgi:diguanylate cyclase (GGDEF)-like protein